MVAGVQLDVGALDRDAELMSNCIAVLVRFNVEYLIGLVDIQLRYRHSTSVRQQAQLASAFEKFARKWFGKESRKGRGPAPFVLHGHPDAVDWPDGELPEHWQAHFDEVEVT